MFVLLKKNVSLGYTFELCIKYQLNYGYYFNFPSDLLEDIG